jgi:rubrerythrin
MAKNSGHKLYGVFKSNYVKHHGSIYRGSVYRDVGMLKRVSDEIGEGTLELIINYYFKTRSKHEVSAVCFNYNEILDEMELAERDRAKRELLRERTRRRIEELGIPLGMETDGEDFDGEDFQYFVCSQCGVHWDRPRQRGRPPKSCPECRGIK